MDHFHLDRIVYGFQDKDIREEAILHRHVRTCYQIHASLIMLIKSTVPKECSCKESLNTDSERYNKDETIQL